MSQGKIITFEDTGLDEVIAKLEKMPLKVRLMLEKTVLKLSVQFVSKVKTEKLAGQLVRKQTGNLAASVRLKQRFFTERSTVVEMAAGGTNAPYAPPVEFGTAPHEIKARNAKALRFMSGGKAVFCKKVQHPGTAPRPFMGDTMIDMTPQIRSDLEAAVREGMQA